MEYINTMCEENSLFGVHTHKYIAFLFAVLIRAAVNGVPANEGVLSDKAAALCAAIKKNLQ
jgi:hypothetical protein